MADSTILTKPTAEDNRHKIASMSPPGDHVFKTRPRFEGNPDADQSGYDRKYLEPTKTACREVQDLVYKELKAIYFEDYSAYLRVEQRFKFGWRWDGIMTNINRPRHPGLGMNAWRLRDYFNKEVIVYFEHNAVDNYGSQEIARYIFRGWIQVNNGQPFFHRDAFFGKPINLLAGGPQGLEELSVFHGDLSLHISTHADDLVEFKESRGSTSSYPGEPTPKDETPGDIRSWREHGYVMGHLFRALYVVVDKQSLPEATAQYDELLLSDRYDRIERLEDRMEERMKQCTVLLVKTGDDAHLSSPISFDPLFEAGLAMHVNRDDYSGGPQDEETVVRVNLGPAVRFIWELLQKEKESFEELKHQAQIWQEEKDSLFETWLEEVMSHCEEVGMDKNFYMWKAIRRAIARANGETFDVDQVYPFWGRLRLYALLANPSPSQLPLSRFEFDEETCFNRLADLELPYLHCALSAHRDARLVCVVDDMPSRCTLCKRDHRNPPELKPVLKAYWNALHTEFTADRTLTRLEKWRVMESTVPSTSLQESYAPSSFSSSLAIKSTLQAEMAPSAIPSPGDCEKKVISLFAGRSRYQVQAFREVVSRRDHFGIDPKYLEVPSSFTPETSDLVRKELKNIFFEDVSLAVRYEDRFRTGWLVNGSITRFNTPRLTDFDLKTDYLIDFFNKEVMVYFETELDKAGGRAKIIRFIYREWLRLHGGRPIFERGGFFAKPAQILSTGPQGLDQITTLHHDISDYIATRTQDLVYFQQWDYKPPRFSTKPKEESPWLQNDGEVRSFHDHRFMLGHLFRALYLLFDDQCLPEPTPLNWPEGLEGNDRVYYLEGVIERQMAKYTVLLIKTGDDAHLSAPISFDPLFEAGQAMCVNRCDYSGGSGSEDGETAVRVSLEVAIRFVWGLLQKEREMSEGLGRIARELEEEQDALFEKWFGKVMRCSREVGFDQNLYTWSATRRALARANGEAFDEDQVFPFRERLRSWHV
ncbi:hypothetical protein FGADI_11014 [Fusarium gaditjirri]|uniref:Uncharacterized protein n=1 Tax=Fusarium gaditjirri TaxID=282569 RepID=A0A8H4WQT4_9HYPO|nr:hypothetical protein FGADI_11014 [Fusarium gaditjirri]